MKGRLGLDRDFDGFRACSVANIPLRTTIKGLEFLLDDQIESKDLSTV